MPEDVPAPCAAPAALPAPCAGSEHLPAPCAASEHLPPTGTVRRSGAPSRAMPRSRAPSPYGHHTPARHLFAGTTPEGPSSLRAPPHDASSLRHDANDVGPAGTASQRFTLRAPLCSTVPSRRPTAHAPAATRCRVSPAARHLNSEPRPHLHPVASPSARMPRRPSPGRIDACSLNNARRPCRDARTRRLECTHHHGGAVSPRYSPPPPSVSNQGLPAQDTPLGPLVPRSEARSHPRHRQRAAAPRNGAVEVRRGAARAWGLYGGGAEQARPPAPGR